MKIKNKILAILLCAIASFIFININVKASRQNNIPDVNSYYWSNPQKVTLTAPLKVRIYTWNNKKGYKPTTEEKTIPNGSKVYLSNELRAINIFSNKLQVITGDKNNKKIHAPIMITLDSKVNSFRINPPIKSANYKEAKARDINYQWNYGFINKSNTNTSKKKPMLLFSKLRDINKYNKLSKKSAYAFNNAEGYLLSDHYNKKLSEYYTKQESIYNQKLKIISQKAAWLYNIQQPVLVKKIPGKKYFRVKIANKLYYLSNQVIAEPFETYNTFYNLYSANSSFDPVGKDAKGVVVPKGDPYYLFKGEKWFGKNNWIYNGKRWVQVKHLS